MSETVIYRAMQPDDAAAVSALVMRTFMTYVAPDYSDQGVQTFAGFVQPDAISERLSSGALGLVAVVDDSPVGMIEMRSEEHVTLLFVDGAYHRRGISRELLRRALELCRQRQPDLPQVTVNSSPYAVEIYQRIGFEQAGPPQERDGIIFIPMVLTLA